MQYIAYTTKGLEEVVILELQQKLEGVSIAEIGDKRVIFSTESSFDKLISLTTVDDIGVLINKGEDKETIDDVLNLISYESLIKTQEFISQHRDLEKHSFSLTISVARSPLKAIEIAQVTKNFITNMGLNYIELDHSNFDLRIFIDGKICYISARLTKESIHKRLYKLSSKPGSLKPTVAASMIILATNFKKDLRVIDNFCGSGTILSEAYSFGNDVFGGDIDPESVLITKNNLTNLGFNIKNRIKLLDARYTKWPDNYFDCAISNLPWDKQIEVKSITNLYEDSLREYFRVLKPNGTLCAIVSKPELFIKYLKKFKPTANIKQIKIGLLGQNPTIVIMKSS